MAPMVLNTLMEWKTACPIDELNLVFPSEGGDWEIMQQARTDLLTRRNKNGYESKYAYRSFDNVLI